MRVARSLRIAGALLLAALPAAAAREFTDDAGRKVQLPDKVSRVYAAGPPASVLVFAIAPDTLIGWTRAFRGDEVNWVAPKYAQLPELGRLTGRGSILYPDLFRHDYRREVAEFHRRFYHQAPSDEQLTRLLAEPGVAPR